MVFNTVQYTDDVQIPYIGTCSTPPPGGPVPGGTLSLHLEGGSDGGGAAGSGPAAASEERT